MKNNNQQIEEDDLSKINIPTNPKPLNICSSHSRDNWMNHKGYKDNHDSSISCIFCDWGTRLPGYMRLINGVIMDLRTINRD